MSNNPAGSSLLLTQHDAVHREHPAQQQQQHHHHLLHRSLHRKQLNDVPDVVTEIVATISIIQQINVDINGNTLGIETIQTHLSPALQPFAVPTDAPSPPPVGDPASSPSLPQSPSIPAPPSDPVEPSPPTIIEPAPPAAVPSFSQPSPTSPPGVTSPEPPKPDSSSRPTDTFAVTSTPSEPTTFPSLSATTNSTSSMFAAHRGQGHANADAVLSSSSSFSQTFTNSSRTNTSVSYLTSSQSSKSSSSAGPTNLSSFLSTASINSGVVAAGTGVAPGTVPQSTSPSDAGNSSNDGAPPTPVVVGGVIGSLAGAAVLIVAFLYILRWRRRSKGMLSLGSGPGDDRSDPSGPSDLAMTERKAVGFTIPAAFASLTNKRHSQRQEAEQSAPTGERGFYRISGRKLPSVLQHGGDGYGDEIAHEQTLSGSSFYQDSQGFHGGGGASSPPLDLRMNRESTGGVPIFRPSPARTPTREQSPFSLSAEGTPPRLPMQRPDVLGRSHASQDGSHTSRFTEEV